ncbi:MAG: hypothetical protein EBZ48_15200 [Proteobacteria bacterium]|nr:hypothetical protein [Pseudomonadota bacterium]
MSSELRHMARAGKSFFFASLWLPRAVRADAAVAYQFCRSVDDLADENPHQSKGREQLRSLHAQIESADCSSALARAALLLIEKYPEVKKPLLELVQACSEDEPGLRIEDCDGLARYAQGVAGTVGLIMYPMLGGVDPRGRRHAAALGVAMQCTNICRDVLEDLGNGRTYLPRTWLGEADIRGLLTGDLRVEQVVIPVIVRVLSFAREQYAFALDGLSYLDPCCRRGIEIAARVYAEIGSRVIVNNRLVRQRSVVSLPQKMLIALKVYRAARDDYSR